MSTKTPGAVTLPPPKRKLFSVPQLVERNPGLTLGGIRWDLFHRRTNGLESSGAVVYRGRHLLVDEDRYLDWLVGGRGAAA